jgi:hypothetical protein
MTPTASEAITPVFIARLLSGWELPRVWTLKAFSIRVRISVDSLVFFIALLLSRNRSGVLAARLLALSLSSFLPGASGVHRIAPVAASR